jgi:uncharacterized protein
MPSIRISNGLLFDPWNPKMGFVSTDGSWNWLGHHLANECRYAGGCKWFYSVAQHCVMASRWVQLPHDGVDDEVNRQIQLAALLHDATEAVLKDIPGPFKHSAGWGGYRSTEQNLAEWIYKQFNILDLLNAPPIKTIDTELLHAEQSVLFPDERSYDYKGAIRIEPWDKEYARDEFNRTLRSLTNS